MERHYSPLDRALMRLHKAVETALPPTSSTPGANPAGATADVVSEDKDRRHAAGLMRVNHAGEVAAQALYRGQALVARNADVKKHLLSAAEEEQSHLQWCGERLKELGEGPSKLDPLWYAGSFAIGAMAGLAGDRWSLGFVEETEKQVSEHLRGHLDKLPEADARSRKIVEAMKRDEERHGKAAGDRGARPLPKPVQDAMRAVARVMTRTAYWI